MSAQGLDIDSPAWVKIGGVGAGVFPPLGLLFGIVAFYSGREDGKGKNLWPPDSAMKRWAITTLLGAGSFVPLLSLVFSYFFATYVYTQAARSRAFEGSRSAST
jgi:hypothetical protein